MTANPTHLGRSRQHRLGRIQTRSRGFLDLLDLGTAFPDDASHARVGDDEFDSNRSGAGNRGDIERLVVDSADNQAECLGLAWS